MPDREELIATGVEVSLGDRLLHDAEVRIIASATPSQASDEVEVSEDNEEEEIDEDDDGIWECPECGWEYSVDSTALPVSRPQLGDGCIECRFECERCNEILSMFYHADAASSLSGESLCENCAADLFETCNGCGELVLSEDTNYCSVCSCYYCNSCFSYDADSCTNCADEQGELQSPGYLPPLNFLSAEGEKRPLTISHRRRPRLHSLFFGVELEIDCGDSVGATDALKGIDDDESRFWLTSDGSLSSNGIEITSHPATMLYHRTKFPWRSICNAARVNSYKSHNTETCGLHVHISREPMAESERIKLALFVYSHKNEMVTFARRDDSGYSAFKGPRTAVADVCADGSSRSGKYEAVNFAPRNTIEFRLFRGTLRCETILATIEFCEALCMFVKQESCPRIIQPRAWRRFTSFVQSSKKKYPELVEYLGGRLQKEV